MAVHCVYLYQSLQDFADLFCHCCGKLWPKSQCYLRNPRYFFSSCHDRLIICITCCSCKAFRDSTKCRSNLWERWRNIYMDSMHLWEMLQSKKFLEGLIFEVWWKKHQAVGEESNPYSSVTLCHCLVLIFPVEKSAFHDLFLSAVASRYGMKFFMM